MYKIINTNYTKLPKEEEEQKALVKWLRNNGYFFFAAKNENNQSYANRRNAAIHETKARAMGKVKGVSDLVIFLEDKILFMELKRQKPILKSGKRGKAKNVPSEEQKSFLDNVAGFKYAIASVAYGCDLAIETIKITENDK